MNIVCPQCDTTFNMPEDLYKPGRKARCSQCSYIFRLPGQSSGADARPAPPAASGSQTQGGASKPRKSRKNTLILLAVLLICMAGIGFGASFLIKAFNGSSVSQTSSEDPVQDEAARKAREIEEKTRLILLDGVRQYVVANKHLRQITVIQGEAVNNFDTQKDLILLEATLYDQDKNPLAIAEQYCGVVLNPFQLEELNEADLQIHMNNKFEIFSTNMDVPPGGRVPFMIVFPSVPENFSSYRVRVIDVQDSDSNDAGQPEG